jgi:DNA-binding LacI/PurR family transcriptional regulator
MKRITIQDVADKAEVSPTAVSFAFNKPEQLNPDTVTRIRSVAWDLGYVPNPHARALISRRTGVIGVAVCAISTTLAC